MSHMSNAIASSVRYGRGSLLVLFQPTEIQSAVLNLAQFRQ